MSASGSGENPVPQPGLLEAPEHTYLFPKAKGHARSVSHGGATPGATPGRPSALRSAVKGHQRAFSQGQISEGGTSRPGHSRTGSKTDFILPPGHREPSATVGNTSGRPSTKGHSRQASRSESIYTLRRSSGPPAWRRAWGWVLRKPILPEERRYRMVVPNHTVPPKTPNKDHPNGKRIGNKVRTTKYTLLSFLPKNLLEQFHRVANLYFIFIVLLNWFPAINAFGKEVAMIPVLFVLGVTAVKDLFEDRRRHASDKRINNSTCRVYKSSVNRYTKVLWKDVRVGDLVHLSNNEVVPADMVLLKSSDPSGLCYLDTCNLDGESNLKPRQVISGFQEKQATFNAREFVSRVEVDVPSTKIYRFHGAVVHPNGKRVPLSSDNLLLRECRVKNTDYIEGIVVYAGHETKAMLNNGGPRYKRSRVERQMNTDVIWCVLMLLVMCCIGAVCCKLWLDTYAPSPVSHAAGSELRLGLPHSADRPLPPYIPYAWEPAYEGLLSFWTFIIILQVMIPLSLYVTIEMTKLAQVYHIHNNVDLYDPTTNKRIECRALNITEELGQVEYIFSDKTGTLTENKMVFRRCTIGGVDYNHNPDSKDTHPMGAPISSSEPSTPIVVNQQLLEELTSKNMNEGSHAQKVREFLLVLALCNTVIVSHTPHCDNMDASGVIATPSRKMPKFIANGTRLKNKQPPMTTEKYSRLTESRSVTPSPPPSTLPSPRPQMSLPPMTSTPTSERPRFLQLPSLPLFNRDRSFENGKKSQDSSLVTEMTPLSTKPIFEAESPDELALVEAASVYGCRLEKRSPREVIVSVNGEFISFPVLNVLPFDSSRKCMSIILQLPNSAHVTVYCKGADTTILEALHPCLEGSAEKAAVLRTQQKLDSYGREGLRTLVMAKRTISVEQYELWAEELKRAELSTDNREKKIRECYSSLENNLVLLGATGIEDRLQEGVPHTIAALIEAGIAVWVLTGDKPETAINVAYSAKLFSPQVELLQLMARNKDQAESTIKCYLDSMENIGINEEGNGIVVSPLPVNSNKTRALVVDGKTLTFILDKRSNLTGPFLELTKKCVSVLCCRATPLQKAYIIKVVKEEMGVSTLAIGDGANDVSMIQTADVGIGISGMEGMQAVMASDFALSRFKYLERFLLVHGHWCYNRLARMILYFFYKNATFVFLVFWFQIYCGWSACVMVDQIFLFLYNLVFTSLPPLAIGIYDRVAPAALLLEQPGLYAASRLGKTYRPRSFWIAMADALYQSIVIFFTAVFALWGSSVDLWVFGVTISSSCIVVMLLHVAIETRSWTILHVLSLLGSLCAFYGFSLIYNAICVQCIGLPSNYWVMQTAMMTPEYWLIIVVSSVVALTPRLVWRAVSASLWPAPLGQAVQQRRRARRIARLPLAAHYHNASNSTHIYRTTDEENVIKRSSLTAVG